MMKKIWAMGLVNDVEPVGIWIRLHGYDPDINTTLKQTLPGPCKWNRDEKRWEFPLHWDTCTGARKVANKYGADLKLSEPLVFWANAEKTRQATIPDVSQMDLVDLPAVKDCSPDMWKAMSDRPFQTVGAAFAARNRSCLIADQPGLGKTLQTIAAVVESGLKGPILVVAPKAAAQLTWPQELARWVPGDLVYVLGSHLKPAERAPFVRSATSYAYDNVDEQRVWVITSPTYLRIRAKTDEYGNYVYVNGKKVISPVGAAVLDLFDCEWSAIVVDESHQTLAGCTGNKKKQSAQRLGLGALNVRKDGLRIALSGTPFRGKESYLWGQLNWLRPDLYRSYRRWVEKHFDTWFDGFGWQTGLLKDRAAMYDEAKHVMIRRTKSEVAKDLPAKTYGGWPLDAGKPNSPVAVWLDMLPKQAKAYESMVKKAEAELDGGTLLVTSMLSELTRLKQFAGSSGRIEDGRFIPSLPSNKFDWLVEFLDERGISKDSAGYESTPDGKLPKIVVTTQFSQLADAFADGLEELGIRCWKFTGSTPDKTREWIKADWQHNDDSEFRVLILTTTAGGTSLTLDAADELVILDETWNTSDQEQVEDRLHRLSRIHQVTIWKVFSRNTIEESIARANAESEVSIKSIIDGERGVAFVRELLKEAS